MNSTTVSILVAALIIGGAIMFSRNQPSANTPLPRDGLNVLMVDGKQIIEIGAKGGYAPRMTTAAAGMPTTIRVRTSGTFDCSSALVIPSINYRKNLPPSGTAEIELPPQKSGYVLKGLCSMGMYNFQVRFQ